MVWKLDVSHHLNNSIFRTNSLVVEQLYGGVNILLKAEERVARLLSRRAYIFTCSYKTAWKQWLGEEEKEGFTYEYLVLDYMVNT